MMCMQEFSHALDYSSCASIFNRRRAPAANAGDRRKSAGGGAGGGGTTALSSSESPADIASYLKTLSLPWTGLIGTILIAGSVQLLALMLWFICLKESKYS